MKPNELPEAPASVTYSITSEDGFNALFTIRDMSGLDLLDKMATIEKKLLKLKYKPQLRPSFGQKKEKDYIDRTCPKDGSRLYQVDSKVGKIVKCENSKYDFTTRTTSGCTYVEFPDKKPV